MGGSVLKVDLGHYPLVCERVEAVETELNRTPRRELQKARSMMIVRRRVDEMAENLLFAP